MNHSNNVGQISRRTFVGGALASGALALAAKSSLSAPEQEVASRPLKVGDKVPLGKSGLMVSVVGMGTGSIGNSHASNQTRLGDEGFTKLVRHAFDNGVNLFDLADSYGSNPFFGRAMVGVPRDQYVIQTKISSRGEDDARKDIDRFLVELKTDHIDSVLIHCVTEADWTTKFRGVMDVLEEAKAAGKVRAHGVSCHSFQALEAAAASTWVQTHLVRWNARRSHMDASVETAREAFLGMKKSGQGLIGMKVFGEGSLLRGEKKLTPQECVRFQIESGVPHAFVIGLESIAQADQVLAGTAAALKEFGYRAA